MWRPVALAAPIAAPLVSFASAAAELRLDEIEEHRARVERYLRAAEGHVSKVSGLQLATQNVILLAGDWSDLAALPVAPVQTVGAIAYVDAAGDTQTLDEAVYDSRLDGLEPAIWLKSNQAWPPRQPGSLITVTAVAGYGADEDLAPGEIVASVLLLARALNDDGKVDAVADTIDALLTNYRTFVA